MNFTLQPLRIPSGWIVEYNELFEIDPDPLVVGREAALLFFKEDLLQFTCPRRNRLVDVGWYPFGDLTSGMFGLVVYEGDFRGTLLHSYSVKSRLLLVKELERVLIAEGPLHPYCE